MGNEPSKAGYLSCYHTFVNYLLIRGFTVLKNVWLYLRQFLVKFRVGHRNLGGDVHVEHQGEDGHHGVGGGVADHQNTRKDRHRREVKDGGEDGLHRGDDQTAVHHELRQRPRPLVTRNKYSCKMSVHA